MSALEHTSGLSAPQAVADLLSGVALSDKKKRELNKKLAQIIRKYYRAQITAQKDINGKSYQPRKRRKISFGKTGKAIIHKKMMTGISRMLRESSDETGLEVGLSGKYGAVGKLHNEGAVIPYKLRIRGWLNKATGKQEGGEIIHGQYRLPKRQFLGWNKELESLVMNEILKAMEPK